MSYTLGDLAAQEHAIRLHQEGFLEFPRRRTEARETRRPAFGARCPMAQRWKGLGRNGPNSQEELDAELIALANRILSLNGGPKRTRISDLFRVKEAL